LEADCGRRGIKDREFVMQATRWGATAARRICSQRSHAPVAVAIVTAALLGCAECHDDGYAMAPSSASSQSTRRAAPARISYAAPLTTHEAKVPLPERVLTAENDARFLVLRDTEVAGRSRTFTGGQSDPDRCAAQCLAQTGCEAFSFAKETKICYLVTGVTETNSDTSFVSGRLR
jgi:hypothetical protein